MTLPLEDLPDDVESLKQWHAGFHHRGELPGEKRNVFRGDLAACAAALALYLQDGDTLPS